MILFRDNQKKIDEAILPLKAKLGELQVRTGQNCCSFLSPLWGLAKNLLIYSIPEGQAWVAPGKGWPKQLFLPLTSVRAGQKFTCPTCHWRPSLGNSRLGLAKTVVPASQSGKLHVRACQNFTSPPMKAKIGELQVWAGQDSCSFLPPWQTPCQGWPKLTSPF